MKCVISFLKKTLNVFQKKVKKKKTEAGFFPSFYSAQKWKSSRTFGWRIYWYIYFFLRKTCSASRWTKSRWLPLEHTASTILFIDNLTMKMKKKKKSIPYWSFGCLQKNTWTFVGAFFFFSSLVGWVGVGWWCGNVTQFKNVWRWACGNHMIMPHPLVVKWVWQKEWLRLRALSIN